MRRLGGGSVLTLLVVVGLLLMGGLALADISVGVYLEIATDEWEVFAPGPSGVTQISSTNMIVVDTERNLVAGDDIDIWEISLTGEVIRSGALSYGEPTGVDYNPSTNTLYVSSDSDGGVHAVTPGDDGLFGTEDDDENFIDIPGGDDVEDPAFDSTTGDLFVLNGGSNGRIYRVDLPSGNVLPNPIDISDRSNDWEGLTITPAGELLAGANLDQVIHVYSAQGQWQQMIDISNVGDRISGLGISEPGAGGDGYDIWVADRQNTTANDGRLWRLTTDGTPPPPPPTTTTTTSATTTTTVPSTTTTTTGGTTTTTTSATTTTTSSTTTSTSATSSTTMPGATTTTTPNPPPPPPDPEDPFLDDNGNVFENAIEWLAAEGVTQGCNPPLNDRFCPNDRVTRGQMAAFLVRAQGYSAIGGDFFTDDDASVFENAINRLRTAGVTQGCNPPTNNRYCPDSFVTRGQMAAFLVRAFGYSDNGGGEWFIDDESSVFENAIDRLATARITQGCNPPVNDRYCPDDYVTRGQMAAFLKRALGG